MLAAGRLEMIGGKIVSFESERQIPRSAGDDNVFEMGRQRLRLGW
jgi:hypothetical protein